MCQTGSRFIKSSQLRSSRRPWLLVPTAAALQFPVVKCVCAGESLKGLRVRLSDSPASTCSCGAGKFPMAVFYTDVWLCRGRDANVFVFLLKRSHFPWQEGQTVGSAQTSEVERGER